MFRRDLLVIVVYHPGYLYGSAFINTMHPFVFDRACQAEARLRSKLGSELDKILVSPSRPTSFAELGLVHNKDYLARVHHSKVIASIVEVYALKWCPRFFMRRWFIDPTLWCTAGTLLAAHRVFNEGLAFNLGGGLHHAKRAWGEGFCLFSDIALAITSLRAEGVLGVDDRVFYIDTDAHQGNGVSTYFGSDPTVRILDIFNDTIYPFKDKVARTGIDVARPLAAKTEDEAYLLALESGLKELFDGERLPKLVIYNAGTDVYSGDALGDLCLSYDGVVRRDMMVLEAVRSRNLPMVVLASGGYSSASADLMADFALKAYRWEYSV